MAMIKTHYYGGIKKYQWTAIPLTLSGTVIKKDGTRLDISLGGEGDDFCFTITDILIHLASEQMKKTMSEGVEGEALNVLAGGIPHFEENEESVKKAVLLLLREKYGIEEEELLTSELEFAPAFPAKDVGLDQELCRRIRTGRQGLRILGASGDPFRREPEKDGGLPSCR